MTVSLLELAVIKPKKYKNNKLFINPEIGRINIIYVEILSSKIIGVNIFFTLKLLTNNQIISGIYFRFKSYNYQTFTVGNILYLQGKISYSENYGIQIINPFKVTEPENKIFAVYKSKKMEKAIFEYMNFDSLIKIGLPEKVVNNILAVHISPTDDVVEKFELTGEFSDDIIYSLKYTEAFRYIQGLQKNSKDYPAIQKLNGNISEWIAKLPFKLTNDQTKTIQNIKTDLNQDIAMRRMVVGDVGSGKTMVILASMIIALPFKTILMSPTSILANQLFEEAKKFLPDNLKIVLLTSKTSKQIVKNGDLDNFDILIGTSAILYKKPLKVPLIIIDEQHRFGTKDRNKLEKLVENDEKHPHFIQLSATPIPRTQAMINSSFIKTSLIEETPFKKDILTKTMFSKDFPQILEKINEEIEKNNQILIIYPLVEESDNFKYQSISESENYWKTKFSNVYVTHGKDKNKEEVLEEFREKGSILLATTVVEVGISLPRLTVIIIVGAEKFGLATLHQLRGRVSRTGLKGFCYLFTKTENETAISRLAQFGLTKNGFDIASMDLENRKSGDILSGNKQSGDNFQWFNLAQDKNIVDEVLLDLKELTK